MKKYVNIRFLLISFINFTNTLFDIHIVRFMDVYQDRIKEILPTTGDDS